MKQPPESLNFADHLFALNRPRAHRTAYIDDLGRMTYGELEERARRLAAALRAAGVRREAGRHAEKINILINELLAGHPISDRQLREVLGHTPLEVSGGILLGLVVSIVFWLLVR